MANETFLKSWTEDADISRKGVNDDVSHCMLPDLQSNGLQIRLFSSLHLKTLASPGKVQMTTLVTACYRALSLTDSK